MVVMMAPVMMMAMAMMVSVLRADVGRLAGRHVLLRA
jgi:hypothetical protein